jgi:hypothetical protein
LTRSSIGKRSDIRLFLAASLRLASASFSIARHAFCGSVSHLEPCAGAAHRRTGDWRLWPSGGFIIAAFLLAALNRMLEEPDSPRGSVLAVIGCIPMIPGSLAAKGLMNLFELMRTTPGKGLLSTTAALENLMLVAFTLVGIGTALAIPTLVFPVKRSDE